jgi:hypothetical protein
LLASWRLLFRLPLPSHAHATPADTRSQGGNILGAVNYPSDTFTAHLEEIVKRVENGTPLCSCSASLTPVPTVVFRAS